jgi:hypothetical protein
MQKVDGVTEARVSLNEGMLTLKLAPANRVSVAGVRSTIRANGFTPKDAEVRVVGRVVARGDALALVVTGSNEEFLLEEDPRARGLVAEARRSHLDRQVVLTGVVPESPKRVSRDRLRVRAVAAVPGAPPARPGP